MNQFQDLRTLRNFCKRTQSWVFDRDLNAPLIFQGIAIPKITYVGGFFVLKLQVVYETCGIALRNNFLGPE